MDAKPVTIIEVAERARVAISSASAALNGRPGVSEATRQRIREAAEELGYVPSLRGRSLSSKRAFTVGLVVERGAGVMESDPFFGAFIGGIEESLAPHGYALAVQVGRDAASAEARYLELASNRRVDGVFLNEIRIDDPRIAVLRERRLPVVGVNADREGFPFPAVRQDGAAAIVELIGELARRGHRRIAHVSGPREYVHSRQRVTAWRGALGALGLDAGLLVEGDFSYAGGYRVADRLLDLADPPTAVFCANDLSAIGFANRALDRGLRIPQDLSIAGFDGIEAGVYVRPGLTSITTAPRAVGRAAAALLLDAIEGEPVADVEIPAAELIVRGSIADAP